MELNKEFSKEEIPAGKKFFLLIFFCISREGFTV